MILFFNKKGAIKEKKKIFKNSQNCFSMQKKSTWKNPTLKKNRGKSDRLFNIEILISYLQNAINTFYNSYYDSWDLITKFWPRYSIKKIFYVCSIKLIGQKMRHKKVY